MAEDDEKSALYQQIVEGTDPWVLLERMQALGFWSEGEPMPEDPTEEREERLRLEDELARLRSKRSTVGDPEQALKKERVRRWKESKKRRALARADREKAREARRAAWDAERDETEPRERLVRLHAGLRVVDRLGHHRGRARALAAGGGDHLGEDPADRFVADDTRHARRPRRRRRRARWGLRA